MRIRQWLALALLALPAAVYAQVVVNDGASFRQQLQFTPGGGIVRSDSTSKMQTMDASGNVLNYQSNLPVGLAFYQSNAIGPISLREGSVMAGTGTGTTPHWGDSTLVIETRGAKRIEVWVYAVFDSANANADSAMGVAFAVLPKAHLSTVADSAGSAYTITVDPDSSITSQNRAAAISSQFVASASSAQNVNFRPLPGEFVVIYQRSWGVQAGMGVPPWAKFDICADNGCFSSEYISLRFRILGHVRQWPQSTYNIIYTFRYTVRVDVKGYYQ